MSYDFKKAFIRKVCFQYFKTKTIRHDSFRYKLSGKRAGHQNEIEIKTVQSHFFIFQSKRTMFYAVCILAFIGLMIASELSDKSKKRKAVVALDKNLALEVPSERAFKQHQNGHLSGHYPPPYYQQGPIFSPDKRYIWDGQHQRWIPNNGGLGIGLIIGLAIGIGLALLLYFA